MAGKQGLHGGAHAAPAGTAAQTQTNARKRTLAVSIAVLLLCIVALIGTTFAWFTSTASNTGNRIQAGTLKVDLVMDKELNNNYSVISGRTGDIFKEASNATNSNVTLWEPGKTQWVALGVQNNGSLALKYNMQIAVSDADDTSANPSMVQDGYSALEYAFIDGAKAANMTSATSWDAIKTAATAKGDVTLGVIQAAQNGCLDEIASGTQGETDYFVLAVHMKEDAGNNFQNAAAIIDVRVQATQKDAENDGFGTNTYDENATYNQYAWSGTGTAPKAASGETVVTIDEGTTQLAQVTIPQSVGTSGATDFEVDVESTTSPSDKSITIATDESFTTYDVSLFEVVDGSKNQIQSATDAVTVKLKIGVVDLQAFYHNSTALTKVDSQGALAENTYYYDQTAGYVYYMTKSFSPFMSVYKLGGGIGTEAYPYLIYNTKTMQGMSDFYETGYKYFKVADGVTTMDCTGWVPVNLHGSFDGNGVAFSNLTACLFQNVGYQLENKSVVLKNFSATMNVSAPQQYGAASLVKNIFNGGTTTFENVDVHGTIEGYWNIGSFYNYGTANYNDVGCDYTVNFVNCQSDATLICTSGNTCGGFLGHVYEGSGHSASIFFNDSSYTGTIYTTGGDGGTYFAMSSDYYNANNHFYIDGSEQSSKSSFRPAWNVYDKNTKIKCVAPVSGDAGYTVAAESGAAKMLVSVTAQLTAYESDNTTKIANLSGITMTLGSNTITEGLTGNVKVLDKVTSAKISTGKSAYGYTLADGVLDLQVASSANYRTGTARLTVTQYDANGNVLACGTTNLYTIENS